MKTSHLLFFELRYQLRRVSTWIASTLVVALTVLVSVSFIDNARAAEFFLNSPIAISAITACSTLFSLVLAATVCSDAAMRDIDERMSPLLYTSSVTKYELHAGRFMAAVLLIIAVVGFAIFITFCLFKILPGSEPGFFGRWRPWPFIQAFMVVLLPNVIVGCTLMFSASLLLRSTIASFGVALVMFFCTLFSMDLIAGQLGKWTLGQLLDFSSFTVLKAVQMRAAPRQLFSELVPIDKFLVLNRLIWITGSATCYLIAFRQFNFTTSARRQWWGRRPLEDFSQVYVDVPITQRNCVTGSFHLAGQVRQCLLIAARLFGELIFSWNGIALIAYCGILFHVSRELMEGPLGVPIVPVTSKVLSAFNFPTFKMVFSVWIMILAGQMIWRERDKRISELTDTAPVTDKVQLLAKLIALISFVVLFHFFLLFASVALQLSVGYQDHEWLLFLKAIFGLQLIDYLLTVSVAVFIHVFVNNKYLGFLLSLLVYGYTLFPSAVGIEHHLLIFGGLRNVGYTEMDGFNESITAWLWFKAYWIGITVVLLLLCRVLWVRGSETCFACRINLFKKRWTSRTSAIIAYVAMFAGGVGGFIFYNTNVLNHYAPSDEIIARRVAYEKQYKRLALLVQPQVRAIDVAVEIFPDDRIDVDGSYTLVNGSNLPVDTLLISSSNQVTTTFVNFHDIAESFFIDAALGVRVCKLKQRMEPGDSITVNFILEYRQEGFSNDGIGRYVGDNGVFFTSLDWFPAIGYQTEKELQSHSERLKNGLPWRARLRPLNDTSARISFSDRLPVAFEAVIGTSTDHVAVTAGELISCKLKDDRKYFHYRSHNPMASGFAFVSARFDSLVRSWNGIPLKIYYDASMGSNVHRMMKSMELAMQYHQENFGHYRHKDLKLVQYPGKGALTSFSGMIVFPDDFALLDPGKDLRGFDLPFAVIAHEVAHQWWGNQLIPADLEGAPLLTESLAWYSALAVVEQAYGYEHLQHLLAVMRQSYLTPRSRADVPLLRSHDRYLAYRKGPFAMQALREYVGEDRVNHALKNLLAQFGEGEPPYATSLDLYAELKKVTPDSLSYLLRDLLERNVFWDMKAERATVTKLGRDRWQLVMDVDVRKCAVDTEGHETELPVDEWIEIGVFAGEQPDGWLKKLYSRRHRLNPGKQKISITLPFLPSHAGIDTDNFLIDTVQDDNVVLVTSHKPSKSPSSFE